MTKIVFFLCALSAGLFTACKKQALMSYNSDNSIYFARSVFITSVSPVAVDSVNISFAFAGRGVTDSTIGIYVAVTGAPTAQDRPYSLVVDKDSSTAKAGVHFVEPAAAQSIKAGKLGDTVYLRLLRTADMLDSSFKIIFRLKANEHFNTAMEFKTLSATRRLHYTKYTVYVNDILRMPRRWEPDYFGEFTRKKLFLICELLKTTPAYLDTQATVADIVFYGRFVQRYLNQAAADGNPIYEENGSRMVMGRLSQ